MKPVRVLLADPAWEFNDRKAFRKDNPEKKARFGIGAAGHYAMGCETTADVCALGSLIQSVIAEDCYLFLWSTCSHMPDAIDVMRAWGFDFKTVAFAWVKTYPKSGEFFKGRGCYTPPNLELVLLGRPKKSKCWQSGAGSKPSQIVCEPQPRDTTKKGKPIIHSRKPESVHQALERWLAPQIGDHAMMELYARERRPGWVCLGGDVTGGKTLADSLCSYALELAGVTNGRA